MTQRLPVLELAGAGRGAFGTRTNGLGASGRAGSVSTGLVIWGSAFLCVI
jgi:hypothetical protein